MFKPEFVEEFVDMLVENGFLDMTFSEAVLDTNFADRSATILRSWIGSNPINTTSQEAMEQGRIVGSALFEAAVEKNVSTVALKRHIEYIGDVYLEMLKKEEEKEEVLEEGVISRLKVVKLCFQLMAGICIQMKEDMTAMEARKERQSGSEDMGTLISNASRAWKKAHGKMR